MAELSLLVKATVVLAVALGASHLARRASAAVRSLILAAAFGLLFVLPLASAALPSRAIDVPAPYSAPLMTALLQVFPPATGPSPAVEVAVHVPGASSTPPPWRMLLLVGWLAGAAGFSMPLLVGLFRVRRLRSHGQRWNLASVPPFVELRLHDDLRVPSTCGVVRPVIALPLDAPQWSDSDLRRVLLHELEHVRRRDWPVHVAARAICALYWFHPLVWMAWRRLRLEAERACDDAVLREASGADYAALLVSLARRITRHDAPPLLSIAGRSHLATRVSAVLAGNVARGPATRAAVVLAVTAVALASLGLGPLQAIAPIQPSLAPPSGPTFETMSIHPGTPAQRCCSVRYSPQRMTATDVDLVDLIVSAFGVYRWQVIGAPPWAGGADIFAPSTGADRFDVQARARLRSTSPDEMRLMLRTALADRFRLAVHTESRTAPIYEMVVEPAGPVLPPAAERASSAADDVWLTVDPNTLIAKAHVDRMAMTQLAQNLGAILRRRVVDRTGLTGTYRVDARWDANPNRPDVLHQPVGARPRDPERPTIFEAFPAQLGLRLRETAGSVEYLVVDRSERLE